MKVLFNCALGMMLLHAAGAMALEPPRQTPVVTLIGNLTETNRGSFAPKKDLLFSHFDLAFEKAASFDAEMLAALPQVEISADFPAGSPPRSFRGPKLADLLAAAGATGETVAITAIDGYTVKIPMADIARLDPVFATAEDDVPLPLGGLGPGFVVFPRLDDPALKDMKDDLWVWGVIAISVR